MKATKILFLFVAFLAFPFLVSGQAAPELISVGGNLYRLVDTTKYPTGEPEVIRFYSVGDVDSNEIISIVDSRIQNAWNRAKLAVAEFVSTAIEQVNPWQDILVAGGWKTYQNRLLDQIFPDTPAVVPDTFDYHQNRNPVPTISSIVLDRNGDIVEAKRTSNGTVLANMTPYSEDLHFFIRPTSNNRVLMYKRSRNGNNQLQTTWIGIEPTISGTIIHELRKR